MFHCMISTDISECFVFTGVVVVDDVFILKAHTSYSVRVLGQSKATKKTGNYQYEELK